MLSVCGHSRTAAPSAAADGQVDSAAGAGTLPLAPQGDPGTDTGTLSGTHNKLLKHGCECAEGLGGSLTWLVAALVAEKAMVEAIVSNC